MARKCVKCGNENRFDMVYSIPMCHICHRYIIRREFLTTRGWYDSPEHKIFWEFYKRNECKFNELSDLVFEQWYKEHKNDIL